MPELPEVEMVRRGLNKYLVGHRVLSIDVLRQKSFPNDKVLSKSFLVGARILCVKRRAKLLLIELSSDYTLAVHLKMTGQLVYRSDAGQKFGAGHPNDSLTNKLPDRSTRVIIALDDAELFFNDQRVFGWIKLLPTAEVPQMEFVKKLGPEPLEDSFTYGVFKKRIMRRKGSQVKAVLLDQTVLAGMGNIYTDEALWHAKIHPKTPVNEIGEDKLRNLYHAIVEVLTEGIEQGGSTDRNYVSAEGKKGSYLTFAKVFRREGEQCLRCRSEIKKIRVAGRGTHVCENCQQPPKST